MVEMGGGMCVRCSSGAVCTRRVATSSISRFRFRFLDKHSWMFKVRLARSSKPDFAECKFGRSLHSCLYIVLTSLGYNHVLTMCCCGVSVEYTYVTTCRCCVCVLAHMILVCLCISSLMRWRRPSREWLIGLPLPTVSWKQSSGLWQASCR